MLHEEGVDPDDAWPQSFNVNDVLYWIDNTRYGRQAVFLVDYDTVNDRILLFDPTGKPIRTRPISCVLRAAAQAQGADHRPGDAGAPRGQRRPRRAVASSRRI